MAVAARRQGEAGSGLQQLIYCHGRFGYYLSVQSDGSATIEGSLDCVGAISKPGKVGCQHFRGSLSKEQVEELWQAVRNAHPERMSLTDTAFPRLELKVDGHTLSLGESTESAPLFALLEKMHPGRVLQKLQEDRAAEERALHPSR